MRNIVMMIFLPWSVMDRVEAGGQRLVAGRVAGRAHNPLSMPDIAPACPDVGAWHREPRNPADMPVECGGYLPVGLRRRQVATRMVFLVVGFALAGWGPLVPFARARAGLSSGALGILLLCLGLGSVVGMPIAARLVARAGCRRVLVVACALLCLALPGLGLASTFVTLAACLLLFGAAMGAMDCVINVQAVAVEHESRRPMMSGFHGMFSVGTLLGAAGASGGLGMGMSPAGITVAGVICVGGTIALAAGGLLGPVFGPAVAPDAVPDAVTDAVPGAVPGAAAESMLESLPGMVAESLPESDITCIPASPQKPTTVHDGAARPGVARRLMLPRGVVLLAGLMCCAAFLVEGAMLDWSAIFLSSAHHLPPARAGGGYVAFCAAMVLGRLSGDAVVRRMGDAWVIGVGAACAAMGLALVVVAPSLWVALCALALMGAGCANIVPVLYGAMGRQRIMPVEAAISGITIIGYAGILIGPALIGLVAQYSGLPMAFAMLAAMLVAVAACARAVAGAPRMG